MRRTRKSGFITWLLKPLCIAIIPLGLFGIVWLRSSVTKASYAIHDLEEKRTSALKETKTLLAERSKLMAISNISLPSEGQGSQEKRLVSGGYVFPDRVKVVHMNRTKGPEAYKASYQKEKAD
jgi:hypothetical protein